jgi:16S rRNA (guanine527-N7)-methyltransferase
MTGDPFAGVPAAIAAGVRAALERSQERGAIGPGPLDEHIAQAAAFAVVVRSVVDAPARIADLGSGGGLPGLVLAALLPESEVILLDGRTERMRLLEEHLALIGWEGRVRAIAGRAEEIGRGPLRHGLDAVVARGFAPPAVTAECGAPLLRPGGALVVSEPPDTKRSALRWEPSGCAALGLERIGVPETGWAFAALRALSPCDSRYPRRTGIPAKRPLF